jgi:hypothetical protein
MTDRPAPYLSWDYATIWQEFIELESKLNEVFDFLQKQESSTRSSDSQLLHHLGYLDGKIGKIFDLVVPLQ